ncbi:PRC-barrel domain-containing protein [Sphingomonas sp.]|uniref:PRC-barrel domain-containing protein n=1 Tax=Sphingomonas sp. TaxID=28214 RepID=UPI003CC635B2
MAINPSSPLLVQAVAAEAPRSETRDGAAVGSVYAYVVDKGSGRAGYAVLSLGGFLGMGKSFYPVPFDLLAFDPVRDVYVVRVEPQVLKGGPSWANHAPAFDAAYTERVARYYAGEAAVERQA